MTLIIPMLLRIPFRFERIVLNCCLCALPENGISVLHVSRGNDGKLSAN